MTSEHPILKVPSAEPAAVDSPVPRLDSTGEPWNVMREKAGYAAGVNSYIEIKTEFDQNVVPPPPLAATAAADAPAVMPIHSGRRINPDPARYVVDNAVAARTKIFRPD